MLQYSFRNSLLLKNPPLKPEELPIRQLLPPQQPQASLHKTISFSHLKSPSSSHGQPSPKNNISFQLQTVNKLKKQLSEKELEINELKLSIAKHVNQQESLREQKQHLIQKYQDLQDQYLMLRNGKSNWEYSQDDSFSNKRTDCRWQRECEVLQQRVEVLESELQARSESLYNYEQRNEESRRLLQKLNENINKKEQKLLSDNRALEVEVYELRNENRGLNQTVHQLKQIESKLSIENSRLHEELQKIKDHDDHVRSFESLILEKQKRIQELSYLLDEARNTEEQRISELKSSLQKERSSLHSISVTAKEHQQQKIQKELLIAQLSEKVRGLTQEKKVAYDKLQAEKNKVTKLEQQLMNGSFTIRESELKIESGEEEIQKMNEIINELKEDKRVLLREKQELKAQLQQKNQNVSELRTHLQEVKEMEIKYSSTIAGYEKEQQRLHEQQAKYIEENSRLELTERALGDRVKTLSEDISMISSKIITIEGDAEKWHCKFLKEERMSTMYRAEIESLKKKSQSKWNQLKTYYQGQIEILQQKIKEVENYSSTKRCKTDLIHLDAHHNSQITSSRIVTTNRRYRQDSESENFDSGNRVASFGTKKKPHPQTEVKNEYHVWEGIGCENSGPGFINM